MGTPRKPLQIGMADALFTPVQQRVLGLLFGQPERRFQSAELIRLARSGTGAVHRLVQRLSMAGLLQATREGNQKYYQANPASPLFGELRSIAIKTSGLAEPIRKALAPKRRSIIAAFIYGSVARGMAKASSDVDLLVISDAVTYPDLVDLLHPAERAIGRTINPTVLSPAEWRAKRSKQDSFAARLAGGPVIPVLGEPHGVL